MKISLNPWYLSYKPDNAQIDCRLICLHYAGGSASFCADWRGRLGNNVELISIQLPGRENRFGEKHIVDMNELAGQIHGALGCVLDLPYAVFGHSMGALIGYELIRRIQKSGQPRPLCFFASGRQAPPFPEEGTPIGELPDNVFCEEFIKRHATDNLAEILKISDYRDVFLPQIRADMRLIENYQFQAADSKLDTDIIALDGDIESDMIPREQFDAWGEFTSQDFEQRLFKGGHFFIHSAEEDVLKVLKNTLCKQQVVAAD